ncbi:substrate-binding domain-containing protein [Danxiaibacter flavus]|uniref:Substrate-binding domain-containing protein n=1 Tax=Danxiaibacter flavus TaxID=3049108 RepID=A0ABV3ZKI9_9BACT|nr:substrate-binding domain-containing protein [Chitinophagaceae bacterium DXS]
MKRNGIILLFALLLATCINAQQKTDKHRFDPPWNTPLKGGVNFTVPGIDNVPDLFGDINDPQLVVFFAGNQFMVLDELLEAFKTAYPQYTRIFVETLPPGILAKQIKEQSLVMGNMRITLAPDIFSDGKNKMEDYAKQGWFDTMHIYAKNRLTIMTYKDNPLQIRSFKDFGKKDVRISMPNPAHESIGKRIELAYEQTGGAALRKTIMDEKVNNGTTMLTAIHHRETPLAILNKTADAGPVWYTEAYYQKMINHPVEIVEIPEKENIYTEYVAGVLKNAPHKDAANAFLQFITTGKGKEIYKKYGFIVE